MFLKVEIKRKIGVEDIKSQYLLHTDSQLSRGETSSLKLNFFFIDFEIPFIFKQKKVQDNEIEYSIQYDIDIYVNILIFIVVLLAFIGFFDVLSYIFAIFIVALVIYFVVRAIVSNHFQKKIQHLLLNDGENTELGLKQEAWLRTPNKCPACGYDITIYDSVCPACGLHLRKQRDFSRFSLTRNIENITYVYKRSSKKIAR